MISPLLREVLTEGPVGFSLAECGPWRDHAWRRRAWDRERKGWPSVCTTCHAEWFTDDPTVPRLGAV